MAVDASISNRHIEDPLAKDIAVNSSILQENSSIFARFGAVTFFCELLRNEQQLVTEHSEAMRGALQSLMVLALDTSDIKETEMYLTSSIRETAIDIIHMAVRIPQLLNMVMENDCLERLVMGFKSASPRSEFLYVYIYILGKICRSSTFVDKVIMSGLHETLFDLIGDDRTPQWDGYLLNQALEISCIIMLKGSPSVAVDVDKFQRMCETWIYVIKNYYSNKTLITNFTGLLYLLTKTPQAFQGVETMVTLCGFMRHLIRLLRCKNEQNRVCALQLISNIAMFPDLHPFLLNEQLLIDGLRKSLLSYSDMEIQQSIMIYNFLHTHSYLVLGDQQVFSTILRLTVLSKNSKIALNCSLLLTSLLRTGSVDDRNMLMETGAHVCLRIAIGIQDAQFTLYCLECAMMLMHEYPYLIGLAKHENWIDMIDNEIRQKPEVAQAIADFQEILRTDDRVPLSETLVIEFEERMDY